MTDAYLDIETTGLSPCYDEITVIGIYLCQGTKERLVQLYGSQVTVDNLVASLQGIRTIYTYNGKRFDLPFIEATLGINLESQFEHHDLMYLCWEHNLKGGLKAVERQLQIPRQTEDVTGYDAVRLWWQYLDSYDEDALNLLLHYNKEDVMNLRILRERLAGRERWREANQPPPFGNAEVVQ